MPKHRLESFSDGVFAIVITLLILNVLNLQTLAGLGPEMLAFALTFVIVGFYWVLHHSMMHMIKAVDCGLICYCCSASCSFRFPHICLVGTCGIRLQRPSMD